MFSPGLVFTLAQLCEQFLCSDALSWRQTLEAGFPVLGRSDRVCALNSGCVFLFGGWKDLASVAVGSRIVISQGHLL